jgi:CRISPR/Cas system-associated exonuclease Cas4 (RecB family)
MVSLPNMNTDPTLEAMHRAAEARKAEEPQRDYLGASMIGDPCERKVWYTFNGYPRKPIEAKGVYAIEDGYRSEDLVAARLRMVEGIELWTHDENGKQFGFMSEDGKRGGHIDGVILGLLQAPQTPHLWENKAVNEKKFNDLKKLIDSVGEKNALEQWDEIYFVQAQIYMHEFKLDRHYLTVCTPGARDITSCRTEYQPKKYTAIDAKTKRVMNAKTPPVRISEDRAFFRCKWCDFQEVCHAKK